MTLSLSLRLANVGLILALASVLDTASAIKCGAVLTSNTALTANLSCNCTKLATQTALTLVGPATLNFNGHRVSCAGNDPSVYSTCLLIQGKGATIMNGSVTACTHGIFDREEVGGAHVIKDMIVSGNSDNGVFLGNANNRLLRVTSKDNSGDGISLLGSNNVLNHVTVKDNGLSGIYCHGNNNRLFNATARDNPQGMLLDGENNTLLYSTVKGSSGDGIVLFGNNNHVKNSYVGGKNLELGILMNGDNNKVISNTIEDCRNWCIIATSDSRDTRAGHLYKNNTFRRCGTGLSIDAPKSAVTDNNFFSASQTSIDASRYDITITGNRITGSGADGITVQIAQGIVMANNVIVNSAKRGIALDSWVSGCTVKNNTIRKCGNAGILIRNSEINSVTKNTISFCRRGINADVAANSNRLINNRASNNTLFDLSDSSTNCGSNVWKGNTGKGNIACTKK